MESTPRSGPKRHQSPWVFFPQLGAKLAKPLNENFCPLDPDMLKRPCVRRFFLRVSLLWTFVFVTNATVGLWLLLTASVGSFVVLKTLVTVVVQPPPG